MSFDSEVGLQTAATAWRRCRKTNTTDASFPDRLLAYTPPGWVNGGPQVYPVRGGGAGQAANPAIYDLTNGKFSTGQKVRNGVLVELFGTGADTNTINCRVVGWSKVQEDDHSLEVWEPSLLAEIQGTLDSGSPGLAAGGPLGGTPAITAAMLFAKTMTLVAGGNANVSVEISSPATTKERAVARIDFFGATLLEFLFIKGTATDANGLFRMI